MGRIILGVAENDAPFPVNVSGARVQSYDAWYSMVRRCYSKSSLDRFPSYMGCEVCEEWLKYSSFHNWYTEQNPPKGWQLDKDILVEGCRVYSPDNCVFVERELNLFVTGESREGRALPTGVCFYRQTNRYVAKCKDFRIGKDKTIGYFASADEAQDAYAKYKSNLADAWIEKISNDPRYRKREELCSALTRRYKINRRAKWN